MSAQPESERTSPAEPGASSSDADLAAWRDAASCGALPTPHRERWQVLRAGVVNLWEFDVAEYWFADGRAQFVGQNQSGKSTLMALTTLIMLAGDLDRQLVDTFGQQHKSFRYYVEPTTDSQDRREADTTVSNGWAWVEYGRLDDGEPRFFTSLLYAQARRGSKDLTRVWATCEGSRVSDDLQLHVNAATRTPADLAGVSGFSSASNGTDFKRRVTTMFGFDAPDRLDAVVRMLKVLRTPHLGQKLDPEFFTEQMRDALPAVARREIDQLAEGWDQLEKLAADRDSAQESRDAVAHYLRTAWNPWADAVLRRYADELVSATTRVDNVTRRLREAETALQHAERERQRALDELGRTREDLAGVETDHEQLLESQAYRDATTATQNVASLKAVAGRERDQAGQTAAAREEAGRVVTARVDVVQTRSSALESALAALGRATEQAVTAAQEAGLPEVSASWAAEADVTRLLAAVTERRGHLETAGELLTDATKARVAEESASEALRLASEQLALRRRAEDESATALDGALQDLSDELESWASGLGPDTPTVELRAAWVQAVTDATNLPAPHGVLGGLLRTQWLAPLTVPLQERAAVAEQRATALRTEAAELDRRIVVLRQERDPAPAAPPYWQRRERPTAGTAGAPLWRLLDPPPDLPAPVLDHVEAALAAAGLLDAWVTPDGAFLTDRDGADNVLAIAATDRPAETPVLGDVLRPADSAEAGSRTVTALLARVGFVDGSGPLEGAFAVASDGRWRTPVTTGRAEPSPHGAELIGTAARAAKRARDLAELGRQADDLRRQASALAEEAAGLRDRIQGREADVKRAPVDGPVVQLAFLAAAAGREREGAESYHARMHDRHESAAATAADANTVLLTFTADHRLPHTAPEQRRLRDALSGAAGAAHELDKIAGRVTDARQRHEESARLLAEARADLGRRAQAAEEQERTAQTAQRRAAAAEAALGLDELRLLERADLLKSRRQELRNQVGLLEKRGLAKEGEVGAAKTRLDQADGDRAREEEAREASLTMWWHPVDLGLAEARKLPEAPGRLLTHALAQARAAREQLRPLRWPDTAVEKDVRVSSAWSRLSGPAMLELRTVLESSGGRSATVLEPDEQTGLAAISVTVDSSGDTVSPLEAVARLDEQARTLAQLHDEKMQEVLVELLSSTFVEHLREQLDAVLELLARVNRVLAAHPTGASDTTMRLVRRPAEGQQDAFAVLKTLEGGFIDDEKVQQQVRHFLEQQIREAQERGRASAQEWKEHLAELLDYRVWFDVVTEFRVGPSAWKPMTKEAHAKDSGGGKVVTLLQPLLATLVALYDESDVAPRPLWLDEAFTGVDDANRATMLQLLVTFDLDFLLAGPGHLVTAAQVPSAAVWYVTRAPLPEPGVDLSLMLWAGRQLTAVPLSTAGLGPRTSGASADDGPGLFDP